LAEVSDMAETETLYDNLKGRVGESIEYARQKSILFGWIYAIVRSLLIIMALTAAAVGKDSTLLKNIPWLSLPGLSLGVAILTGFDTWLKPGVIWTGHARFNDEYIAMDTELEVAAGT